MRESLLEYLRSQLDERRKALIEAIGDGSAKDYAEYQSHCGQVRGLLFAMGEIDDLLRNLKESDE
jgi:hypothetical protein